MISTKLLKELWAKSDNEKSLYHVYHPHLAPEVINGTRKQSTANDMFLVGKLLQFICQKYKVQPGSGNDQHSLDSLKLLAMQCVSASPMSRLPAFYYCKDYKIYFKTDFY